MPRPLMQRRYEFESPRWSRVRDDQRLVDCVVVSVRTDWEVQGYECRLYVRDQLCYFRSFPTRRLAEADADSLLSDVIDSLCRRTPPAKYRSP